MGIQLPASWPHWEERAGASQDPALSLSPGGDAMEGVRPPPCPQLAGGGDSTGHYDHRHHHIDLDHKPAAPSPNEPADSQHMGQTGDGDPFGRGMNPLGENLVVLLVLALGAALALGNIVALVNPRKDVDEGELARPPLGRSIIMISIGLTAAVWALLSLFI